MSWLKNRPDIRQRVFWEPAAGEAAGFDELADSVEVGMGGEVSVKDDFISDAAAGAADKAGVVAVQADKSRGNLEDLEIRILAAGLDNPLVVSNDGLIIDNTYAAFGVALADVNQFHLHILCCLQEFWTGAVQIVDEIFPCAGGVERNVCRIVVP